MSERPTFDRAETADSGGANGDPGQAGETSRPDGTHDGPSPQAVPCSSCAKSIGDEYFTINQLTVCRRCKDAAAARLDPNAPGGGRRFLRALRGGAIAAIVGSVAYYAISKLTGYELAIVTIAIGYFVGKAVATGSEGRGGWRYQALAVGLTYLSVVSIYVPLIFEEFANRAEQVSGEAESGAGKAKASDGLEPKAGAEPAVDPAPSNPAPSNPAPSNPAPSNPENVSAAGAAGMLALGVVFLFGFAMIAPFLAGFDNILGLLIIAFGLYEAWKLNRRTEVDILGPFRVAPVELEHVGASTT
ncbi:MAG: hypothetical protein HY791_15035 [Deltaproteobacteria bacterium]|nr:hypothetical protein [Deltaproteobacteria bacterium]